MEIKSIEIKNIIGGGLRHSCENVHHIKSLPYLSVVQAVHGYYDIALNGNPPLCTGEGGAFIAPAGAMQSITHHNGDGGYMEAQWVFMKIIINGIYDFQDCFNMPLIISENYRGKLYEPISVIVGGADICRRYEAAYRLTDILIAVSSMKAAISESPAILLKNYIDDHFNEAVTNEALAEAAFCSVPNMYRIFQKSFHMSPRNYINKIRLEKASVLLENSTLSVVDISEAVGFGDPIYFSKLFKKSYLLSPRKYREAFLSQGL